MPATRQHGLVTGYHRDDIARHRMIPPADIPSGRCVGCGCQVFLNANGISAVRERDADVICRRCDRRDGREIEQQMIES